MPKLVEWTVFYLNTVGQTQKNLISSFFDNKNSSLLQSENLKSKFGGILYIFLSISK